MSKKSRKKLPPVTPAPQGGNDARPSQTRKSRQRLKKTAPQPGTCSVVCLGCPKNLVDAEQMMGRLGLEGYRFVSDPVGAELVVVNTCAFIDVAREESFQVIDDILALKQSGSVGSVIVAGCLAERMGDELLSSRPQLDQIIGVFARNEIATAAQNLKSREKTPLKNADLTLLLPQPDSPLDDSHRTALLPQHTAYLKIAEGCDRACSFCSIPKMRGRYSSKPIDAVVAEAQSLAESGVRELILIAQDTSYYGSDIYGKPSLAELLRKLDLIETLDWIRLMYLYPNAITDELIGVIAGGAKILPYLDIPLQHINDEILQAMRRGMTRVGSLELIERLRRRIDGLVLRTTLMTGFPGETDAQFQELLDFVVQARFERLGAFAYCDEPDTASFRLDGSIPVEIRQQRRDALLAAQQPISVEFNQGKIGKPLKILLDSVIEGEKNAYIGRSLADAPEVDGVVYVTAEGVEAGQIIECEVVAAQQYDLIAVAVPTDGDGSRG